MKIKLKNMKQEWKMLNDEWKEEVFDDETYGFVAWC